MGGAGGATAIININKLMASAPQIEVRDLAKNEMPRLVGLAGAFRGKEFYLMRNEWKVGRTEENDLQLDHQSISRQHCKFVLEDGIWKVYDNKSANGVRLNGDDYAVTAVKPGDTIELGHVKFRFCAPGEKFTAPAEEKPAGAAPSPSLPLPGTPSPRAASASAAKSKSKAPLFIGIGVGVVALAAVAFFLLKPPGEPDGRPGLSAEAAIKEGDHAAAQHDYLKAVEMYDLAASKGTNKQGRKKAADEARAQGLYNEIDKAIAAGDFDTAKAKLDALGSESQDLYYAKKGAEKVEPVKQGFVKSHLAKAAAAKGSNAPECEKHATLAMQADSANEAAQSMLQACKGGGARPVADRPQGEVVRKAPVEKGPSQAERNAQAQALVAEGNVLSTGRDYDGATEKYQAALKLKPTGGTLGYTYRGLGVAAAQKADKAGACTNFKQYLPFAPDSERKRIQELIAGYCK